MISEAGALTFDADLVRNSENGHETRVCCAERIALPSSVTRPVGVTA
jgi:hypothetical protein